MKMPHPPHILPSLTVTKSVPPPLRDVINGWPHSKRKKKRRIQGKIKWDSPNRQIQFKRDN